MRRIFVFIAILLLISSTYGQKSIDELFSKYAGKEGYTTVRLIGIKKTYSVTNVDPDFISTIDIGMLEGRNFSWEIPDDMEEYR